MVSIVSVNFGWGGTKTVFFVWDHGWRCQRLRHGVFELHAKESALVKRVETPTTYRRIGSRRELREPKRTPWLMRRSIVPRPRHMVRMYQILFSKLDCLFPRASHLTRPTCHRQAVLVPDHRRIIQLMSLHPRVLTRRIRETANPAYPANATQMLWNRR